MLAPCATPSSSESAWVEYRPQRDPLPTLCEIVNVPDLAMRALGRPGSASRAARAYLGLAPDVGSSRTLKRLEHGLNSDRTKIWKALKRLRPASRPRYSIVPKSGRGVSYSVPSPSRNNPGTLLRRPSTQPWQALAPQARSLRRATATYAQRYQNIHRQQAMSASRTHAGGRYLSS